MLKRATDVFMSALGLVALSPTLLIVAIAIVLDSRGPVFYRGVRIGRGGVPFRIIKFRTMVVNAEKFGGTATSDGDPRITRLGRPLRKYKLDELPQLINVLRGEMSLVGPRPEVPQYVEMLSEEERVILTHRPGITDWATLWDADEGAVLAASADPERTYLDKIRPLKTKLQLEYVRNQSFWTDLIIISRTIAAIVFRAKPGAMSIWARGNEHAGKD
jgi:lipopolysaccharide/colanic/teichoic acid biosynthesis glycosyltransferase